LLTVYDDESMKAPTMSSLVRRSLVVLLFAAAVSAVSLLFLPTIMEHWVVPVLLKRISLENQTVQLVRVTPFSATWNLSIEDDTTPVLALPRIKLLFSPRSLLERRVDTLLVENGVMHLTRKDGRIRLRGFSARQDADIEPPSLQLPLLPFRLDSLVLKQLTVVLHESEKPDLRLTVTAHLSPGLVSNQGGGFEFTGLDGTFLLSGALSGTGRIGVNRNGTTVDVTARLENGRLNPPYYLAGYSRTRPDPGPLAADLKLQFDMQSRSFNNLDLRADLDNFFFAKGPLRLEGGQAGHRVSLSITGPPADLSYAVSPVRVTAPMRLDTELQGTIMADKPMLYSAGTLKSSLHPKSTEGDAPIPAELSYNLTYIPGGQWLLNLSGNSRTDAPVSLPERNVSLALPPVRIEGEIHGDRLDLNGSLTLSGGWARLRLGTTDIDMDGFELRTILSKKGNRGQVLLTGDVPSLDLPGSAISVDDLTFNLPLYLPFDERARSGVGSFAVGSLIKDGADLAALTANIRQEGTRFSMSGTASALFDPDMELTLKGFVAPLTKQVELDWQLPSVELSSQRLPFWGSAGGEREFGATLEASGAIRLLDKGWNGSMQAELNNGFIRHPDKNISLDGIQCGVELRHLPLVASEPSQRCSFDNLAIGTFGFSQGRVDFRVEDVSTLFVEKSGVNWAQGTLESGSMRLSTTTGEIDTTLYASRINFSDLLNQFGFDQTDGQGALNGKLPIRLSSAGVSFDDGFLFSTPGTGGIIRFTNTDMLNQAMGGGSETGYLQYSLMALEDFAYNWTRLSFNSSQDDLLMTMELDGKPRTPLPFAFKNGMITAVDQGEGLQYPIRLDVNFNMELNELLKVGKNLQSIMGN
jgi:hypothetical protein